MGSIGSGTARTINCWKIQPYERRRLFKASELQPTCRPRRLRRTITPKPRKARKSRQSTRGNNNNGDSPLFPSLAISRPPRRAVSRVRGAPAAASDAHRKKARTKEGPTRCFFVPGKKKKEKKGKRINYGNKRGLIDPILPLLRRDSHPPRKSLE